MQFRYPVRLSKVRLPDQDRDRRAGPGPAAGPPVRSYTSKNDQLMSKKDLKFREEACEQLFTRKNLATSIN